MSVLNDLTSTYVFIENPGSGKKMSRIDHSDISGFLKAVKKAEVIGKKSAPKVGTVLKIQGEDFRIGRNGCANRIVTVGPASYLQSASSSSSSSSSASASSSSSSSSSSSAAVSSRVRAAAGPALNSLSAAPNQARQTLKAITLLNNLTDDDSTDIFLLPRIQQEHTTKPGLFD